MAKSVNNFAFRVVCQRGLLEVVKYLVENFNLTIDDVRSDNNFALRHASVNRHSEVVTYLANTFNLTIDDARSGNDFALLFACFCRQFEIATFLVTRFDFTKENLKNFVIWNINERNVNTISWYIRKCPIFDCEFIEKLKIDDNKFYKQVMDDVRKLER